MASLAAQSKSAATIEDYDAVAAAFDAGNKDHDVSQNIDALLAPLAGRAELRLVDVREVVGPLLEEMDAAEGAAHPHDRLAEARLDLRRADAGAAVRPRDREVRRLIWLHQDRRAPRRRPPGVGAARRGAAAVPVGRTLP